jgi:hypothetical protein
MSGVAPPVEVKPLDAVTAVTGATPSETSVIKPKESTVMLGYVYEPGVAPLASREIMGVDPPDEAIGAAAVTSVTPLTGTASTVRIPPTTETL